MSIVRPIPPARIDIYDAAAVTRWAALFGITEPELRASVRRYGAVASTVRACLGLPPA